MELDQEFALQRCHDEMRATWRAITETERPPIFWHYTSAGGFTEMVTKRQLRFTHHEHLNDPEEIAYGRNLVRHEIHARIKNNAIPGLFRKLFEIILAVDDDVWNGTAVFLFSLSALENSLSQWRAYGGSGAGYAVGFERKFFEQSIFGDKNNYDLIPVVYNDVAQQNVVAGALDSAMRAADKIFPGGRIDPNRVPEEAFWKLFSDIGKQVSWLFLRLVICMKRSAFRDEGEWRLVQITSDFNPATGPFLARHAKFTTNPAGLIRAHVDLPQVTSEEEREKLAPLPISDVHIGPAIVDDRMKAATEYFLRAKGYSNFAVHAPSYRVR